MRTSQQIDWFCRIPDKLAGELEKSKKFFSFNLNVVIKLVVFPFSKLSKVCYKVPYVLPVDGGLVLFFIKLNFPDQPTRNDCRIFK
jgi:hypothetical protein